MSEKIKEEEFTPRENAPIFPLGFRLGTSKEVCIIDFIDIPDNGIKKVSFSIAMTKSKAEDLVEQLNQFIDEE